MRHWQLKSPDTEQDWQRYYQLRWQILRAPWQQPAGSERDEMECHAYHLMLLTPEGDLAAVGRLHRIEDGAAQVRYMAVADAYQGMGAGRRVLAALELQAAKWGCQCIRLNARETALGFYQGYGYSTLQAAPAQFGIAHTLMQKQIRITGTQTQHQQWCDNLSTTWQQTIPLSQFMQLSIQGFDGNELRCAAPLAPNINLHKTMFAGSIYTLATLTGWGMLYLQLQALGLSGDQVLADASIRYFTPVTSEPEARCVLQQCIGELVELAQGKKVKQQIRVQIYSADKLAAEFTGKFAVLPHKV